MMPTGPIAIVVTDLGYGDSGKGAIADLLCHNLGIERVYRHCGGPNSVHHVGADGRDIAVSAFGSYVTPATRTHLGPEFALKPANILREARLIERSTGFFAPSPACPWILPPESSCHITPLSDKCGRSLRGVLAGAARGREWERLFWTRVVTPHSP